MTASDIASFPAPRFNADRTGIVASVLCAVHCALTPALLIFAPAFGKIWSHPASHWVVALFVVPLAIMMVVRGFRRHRKAWVVAFGGIGVTLVVAGAGVPYWEQANRRPQPSEEASPALNEPSGDSVGEADEFVYVVGESEDDSEAATACPDACCPSLVAGEDGELRLHIPLASIITTLGGLALIVTHVGNLCCCASCRKAKNRKFAAEPVPLSLAETPSGSARV